MKIGYCSDLHIDISDMKFLDQFVQEINDQKISHLIIAGDLIECRSMINRSKDTQSHRNFISFFESLSKIEIEIYWIFGNHEFYGCEITSAVGDMKSILIEHGFNNVTILDNSVVDLGDHQLVASTLWTDFKHGDPVVMSDCGAMMNDYNFITENHYQLGPNYIYDLHSKNKDFIRSALENKKNTTVVTHHLPHYPLEFNGTLDYAYGSDLSDLFLDNSHLKFWVCGHSHQQVELDLFDGMGKILSNARGYEMYEPKLNSTFRLKTIEL